MDDVIRRNRHHANYLSIGILFNYLFNLFTGINTYTFTYLTTTIIINVHVLME